MVRLGISRFGRFFAKAWQVVGVTRVSGLVAAALLLVGNVPQCHDLLRFMFEDGVALRFLVPLFIAAGLASLAIWYSARVLIYQILPGHMLSTRFGAVRIWTTWYPRLLGCCSWLAIIEAAWPVAADKGAGGADRELWWLRCWSAIAMGGVVLFQWGRFRLGRLVGIRKNRNADLQQITASPAFKSRGLVRLAHPNLRIAQRIIWISNVSFLVALVAVTRSHGRVALQFGALPVVFLSLALITVLASGVVWYSIWSRLPLGIFCLAWVAALSALSLNDNHQVRKLPGRSAAAAPELAMAFTNWFAHRQDLHYYTNFDTNYPVALVSTEGGGIRAAYHTAMVLGALQDANPRFAQHVFAISGVSGGSVGATLFAQLCALCATNAPQPTPSPPPPAQGFRHCLNKILDDDWVAPAMAMLLFSDLAQKFWPHPISWLDRAPALELAMEKSWTNSLRTNLPFPFTGLDKSFYALADGFESNAAPALFLNTTHVESGQRVVVTPFQTKTWESGFLTLDSVDSNTDIRISTAAFLSARFPIISPAALVRTSGTNSRPEHLVDGGVFEDSGCATLADVYRVLNKAGASDDWPTNWPRPRFIFLRIDTVDAYPSLSTNKPPTIQTAMLFPPLTAFLNSRDDHASVAAFNLTQLATKDNRRLNYNTNETSSAANDYRTLKDAHKVADIAINRAPMGWTLSMASRVQINHAYDLNLPDDPIQLPFTNAVLRNMLRDLRLCW